MDKGKEKGPGNPISVQKSEVELSDLEMQIEKYRQQLRLLKSEEKAEKDEKNEIIEKQQQRIKDLKANVEALQIALIRGKSGDERILKKAFQKHFQDVGIIKDKSAQEVAEILENRVFDLSKKRDILCYELGKKQSRLDETKHQCQEMDQLCQSGEDDKKLLHRAKELENEFQKAEMRITEMGFIQKIYKDIVDKMAEDLATMPPKIEMLEGEFKDQQDEIQSLLEREAKARTIRDQARAELTDNETKALHARQEKDKVMLEFNQVLEQKQMQMLDEGLRNKRESAMNPPKLEAERVLTTMKSEQEKQLEHYREAFEKIKIATGVADIEEAEKRFASQRAVRTNLLELKKRSEKMFRELKTEKQHLETEIETLMGANLACSQITLEETLDQCKREQESQTRRKEAATSEFERITNTLAEVKTGLWQLFQLIERHLKGVDDLPAEVPDISVSNLSNLVLKRYEEVLTVLQEHDVKRLTKRMKDEQTFLKKLEEEKPMETVLTGKSKPQAEEESSSDDEEIKKRATLKKDAQGFADIKQKQKGRGRGFKM